MTAAIEVQALSKQYPRAGALGDVLRGRWSAPPPALAEVDLAVPQGEILGLLGPNGAGKTTLIRILSGLVIPTAGCAAVAGFDVGRQHRMVRAHLGLVTSEERSFYWRLSGRQNLHFFGRLCGLGGGRLRARAQELLEEVGLAGVADRPFRTYSSGMKQRLALARALLHDPPVLILDEPTRSLDPSAARRFRGFVREELNRGRGKTILLATHDLDEAEALAHRIAILSAGRVRRWGTVAEVRAAEHPRDRYRVEVVPGFQPQGDGYALAAAPEPAGRGLVFRLETDRGGAGLTAFLREALSAGCRVAACERVEMPLREVFERVVAMEDAEPATAPAPVPPVRGDLP